MQKIMKIKTITLCVYMENNVLGSENWKKKCTNYTGAFIIDVSTTKKKIQNLITCVKNHKTVKPS